LAPHDHTHDLASLGWDDHFRTAFIPYDGTHIPGRVARVDRGAVGVMTADATVRAAYEHDTDITVGDWVGVALDSSRVDVVLQRRTAFVRGTVDRTSRGQVLAANIDTVFVTVPVTNATKLGLVERFVALGWESGATPVVLITKCDLVDDPETIRTEVAATTPGADVHAVSAHTGDGVELLLAYAAPGRTVAFLGQSGVGKSTLVNALTGDDVMETQRIRGDGKGRHTTTHRELVPVPGGGVLIDTPGLRGLELHDADDGLERTFADVEELATRCRFNDCGHRTEPGCAVLAAVSSGAITQRRLDSWRKLRREAAWIAARTDARLRAERTRQWKVIHMDARRARKARP
jgi:ribosome biogenesis GTPase